MTLLPTTVVTDAELPDGILDGYDASGTRIVSMRYMPGYQQLLGTAESIDEVVSWHTGPEGVRRIASIAAWNRAGGHPTAGSA